MDIIRIILKDLNVRDILSALLVNREWCRAAVPFYWKAPFSFTSKRSRAALKIYQMYLEQGSSSTSAQGEALKVLPFFDYPLFIKELNYTNLLMLVEKIELILQMLTDRGARLETFIIENVRVYNYNEVYGLWTRPCYVPLFNTLIHVEVHFPFMNNNFIKPLAENCARLGHHSQQFAKESINSLEKLISAQRCPLNLRLVYPNGPGHMLIKAFQSGLEYFQRLELVKWNFAGCDWSWLNNCPNLTEFAITNPPPQVFKILGTENESYLFRPSLNKKSRVLTEHWHFDKDDDEISSMQKFFFHHKKSLRVRYDPRIVS
ncbi:9773_t:CDS:2 [Diversispora eburnea]|uniref:9773_t:CDS:1 n=1 Tax=Diversispora eburnea TaxID=1213867 RepID=A0A9N9BRX9_9GLOM|nr:9773_t:CDS:2 [Diversispora eburnea]